MHEVSGTASVGTLKKLRTKITDWNLVSSWHRTWYTGGEGNLPSPIYYIPYEKHTCNRRAKAVDDFCM